MRGYKDLRPGHLLIAVIAISVVLRIGVALYMGDTVTVLPGIFDQLSYNALAQRIVQGHGFSFETGSWPITPAGTPTAFWSYLYVFYLVFVYQLFGVHPLAARLLQAVLVAVLMPWLAFRLGAYLASGASPVGKGIERLKLLRMLKGGHAGVIPASEEKKGDQGEEASHPGISSFGFPETVGLIAAGWVAFYPYFIYYSAALMTEMLYVTAILCSLEIGTRFAYSHKRSWGRYALLGLSCGTAVLLRQVYLVFVPFLFAWIVLAGRRSSPFEEKESLQSAQSGMALGPGDAQKESRGWQTVFGVALAGSVLVGMILPFTLWNYHRFGRFVLLNTNAGYAFFWANHPIHGDDFVPLFTPDMPSYQELIPEELRSLDEAALDQELMRRGVGFVLEDPWRYLRLSLSRIDDHFIFWPKADSSLLSNITRVTSIGVALPFILLGTVLWKVISWKQESCKFFTRLWGLLSQPGGLLLLFIVIYVGVHLLSWAGIRYRLPADAVMLFFAAYCVGWILRKVCIRHEDPVPD